jgi:hypothetical protein
LEYLINNDDGYTQAVFYLVRGWIQPDSSLTAHDHALQSLLGAIESSVLARHLENAADRLSLSGETTATVLAKIGQALEDMLLTDAGHPPITDVTDLLQKLIGEERD